ncbi:MAG: DNA replication/repair protein RecF [Pseudomonadota bacterium]|nr:DNA replication/repair protein RecF [Pseudomonadota bacterium]
MSRLSRISVHHLRNLSAVDLTPNPLNNVLSGHNGSGKTSFLEAIHILATGRSFRTRLTSRIIQETEPTLQLHAKIVQPYSEIPVGMAKHRDGQTQVKVSGETVSSIVHIAEMLPIQLLYPDGHSLLTGSPKLRRQFIDWGVFHVEHQFFHLWQRAERITKQRNALLRQGATDQQMQSWNNELCVVAASLHESRAHYVEQLLPEFEIILASLLPEIEVKINYYRGWQRETNLSELLATNMHRDRELGYTQIGPHRADLKVTTNNMPAKDILSQGQQKAIVYALRLAQGKLLQTQKNKQSIYLIDDLPAELDSEKRKLIAEHLIATGAQVFVTGTDKALLAPFTEQKNVTMFHVEHGNILK